MTWTVPIYAGTQATGDPSNWRIAMFELCRAVNERQALRFQTKTQWRMASGSTTANISMAQLDGLNMPQVEENLIAIQDAIVSMVDDGIKYFTEESGVADYWTSSALETAIGTDLSSAPTRPNEARFWQAQQDALDLIIHGTYNATGSTYSGTAYAGAGTDLQDAWDNKYTTSGAYTANGQVYWSAPTALGSGILESNTVVLANAVSHASIITGGTLTGNDYILNTLNEGDIDMDVSVGSASHTVEVGDNESNIYIPASSNDLNTSYTQTLTIDNTPSTVPFSAPIGAGKRALTTLTGARLYIDLTDHLTDQA